MNEEDKYIQLRKTGKEETSYLVYATREKNYVMRYEYQERDCQSRVERYTPTEAMPKHRYVFLYPGN